MKLSDYHVIIKFIEEHDSSCGRMVLSAVIAKFNAAHSHDTLLSVFLNYSQRKVKVTYGSKTREENAKLYFNTYKEKVAEMKKTGKSSHFLVELAIKFGLPPGLMARIIIEQFLKGQSMRIKIQNGNKKSDVNGGDMESNVSALTIDSSKSKQGSNLAPADRPLKSFNVASGCKQQAGFRSRELVNMSSDKMLDVMPSKNKVSMWIKDPYLITDVVLKEQVLQCMSYDVCYGPINDAIRHSVGLEFEEKLKTCVLDLNLPFLDENDLRKRGYDKTPDVKLEVPLAVNGHPVCWIESKASFGDLETHNEYLRGQYYSYWNRFGPGLVIYWFGFIDEISEEMQKQGILIMDHFPDVKDVTFMNP